MLNSSQTFSSFSVDDLAAARAFYGETLGVDVEFMGEGEMQVLFLNLAGGRTMIYAKDDHAAATFTVLHFLVDDVEGTVDGLTQKGVRFEHYDGFDQDEKGIMRGEGPEGAWFTDPAGNVLGVMSAAGM